MPADPHTKLDILYGKMNALEIVLEETFAALLRRSEDGDTVLTEIAQRARRKAEQYRRNPELGAIVAMETEDSVTRLIQNLSIVTAGTPGWRSRGS